MSEFPIIGVQLNIEPARTDEQVDAYFHIIGVCGLSLCRINLYEAYCPEGDFSLYDRALDSARRHSVKVILSLSGSRDFYLAAVRHFCVSPVLYAWEYTDGNCGYDEIKAIDGAHDIIVTGRSFPYLAKDAKKDALGVSIMPGTDFKFLRRRRFCKGVSALCDMAASTAGDKPFWITELQGGSNIYSGSQCFTPTARELSQWIWTAIGAGAKGVIIKSLNSASDELVAGEMSLLNLQGGKTVRSVAVAGIAHTLLGNHDIFSNIKPVKAPVTVIYTRESFEAEKRLQRRVEYNPDYEIRYEGGVLKSIIAAYEILSDRGILADIKEISEYDWNMADARKHCVVFAGQLSVPLRYYPGIREFVKLGGQVIIEGLSFCYDENMNSVFSGEFMLSDVFGGYVEEYQCRPGCYKVRLKKKKLWTQLFSGLVRNEASGETLSMLRNRYGRGRVLWIPSSVAFGAVATEHRQLITRLLFKELAPIAGELPLVFRRRRFAVTMRQVQTPEGFVTIVCNNSSHRKRVRFHGDKKVSGIIYTNFYHEHPARARKKNIKLRQGQTAVVLWKDKTKDNGIS